MRIGLDLDGTIVLYDAVFHRHATERFGLPPDVPVDKTAVRDWLRANAPGERGWIELQRIVYGLCINEAVLAPGVAEFVSGCRQAGAELCVVSHKTRLSVATPPVDLHAAARRWLEENGFFAAGGLGLTREHVFFEPTRAAKLERIAAEGCVLFVDDLEEVFAEEAFPAAVERWLYVPDGRVPSATGVTPFSDWRVVLRRVEQIAGERS